jgi:hypothetical protein
MLKTINFRFVAVVAFISGIFVSFVYASSEVEIRQAIQNVLKVRHPSESGNWWQSLGPTAPGIIISMYHESHSIYEKIRLVDSLAWFDDSAATHFLKNEAKNNPNRVIQSSAIRALSLSQGMKERDFLSQSLLNKDPVLRAETAKALSHISDPEADKMLGTFLAKEKNTRVSSEVDSYRATLSRNPIVYKKSRRDGNF